MTDYSVKRLINVISDWDIEKIEAFYLFLKCYWKFWDMCKSVGGQRFPYRETVLDQLKLRGLDGSFDEFKKLCELYVLKGEKIDAILNYIEDRYRSMLENLIRNRLRFLTEDERAILEYLADWCCSRNEFVIKNFDYFLNYMPNRKELKFLFKNGLLMLGGYTTVGARDRIYYHDNCFVPPWVQPIIQEVFRESSEIPEYMKKTLEKIEEKKNVRGICPICGRKILYGEKWTKVFGEVFHASCFNNKVGFLPRAFDERTLGELFKKLDIIPGEYLWEVQVGESTCPHPYLGKKRIDLVIRTQGVDWVIEIERTLNYEAIGQVLVYEELWRKRNPSRKTRKGIICFTAPKDMLEVAEKNDIQVFCYQ